MDYPRYVKATWIEVGSPAGITQCQSLFQGVRIETNNLIITERGTCDCSQISILCRKNTWFHIKNKQNHSKLLLLICFLQFKLHVRIISIVLLYTSHDVSRQNEDNVFALPLVSASIDIHSITTIYSNVTTSSTSYEADYDFVAARATPLRSPDPDFESHKHDNYIFSWLRSRRYFE